MLRIAAVVALFVAGTVATLAGIWSIAFTSATFTMTSGGSETSAITHPDRGLGVALLMIGLLALVWVRQINRRAILIIANARRRPG